MADFHRFNQLLRGNDYSIIEYFSYNKYCNLVKVMHILTGNIFFISIMRNYRMLVPMDIINHYSLTREDLKNREFTSSQLTDYYPMIKLDTDHLNGSEDITDQIKVSYKQPISLHSNTAFDYINQMKRLKYCFKTLEYKVLIQTDQYIINLNSENTIDIFKMENYPKTNANIFYIVIGLEQFYSKVNIIHDLVDQVESELYEILDMNQKKHNEYLNDKCIEFFINNNEKFIRNKQQLHKKFQETVKILNQLQEQEDELSKRYKQIESKSSYNIFRDAEKSKQKEQIDTTLKKVKETKLQILDSLLKLDMKIKNMYLVLDQLGFNMTLSFNELKNELYKMVL